LQELQAEVELHPGEPHLTELLKIRRALYADSTVDNTAKIKAIEKQIERHQKAGEKATIIPPEPEK
jgi:hypothetical protein